MDHDSERVAGSVFTPSETTDHGFGVTGPMMLLVASEVSFKEQMGAGKNPTCANDGSAASSAPMLPLVSSVVAHFQVGSVF